jgi:hypothetical protein
MRKFNVHLRSPKKPVSSILFAIDSKEKVSVAEFLMATSSCDIFSSFK